jgi:hypothetical protein
MITAEKPIFIEEDYSMGLVTVDPLNIPKGASPVCKNVHSNRLKTLEGRLGQSILNSSAAAELRGNGLFDYAVSDTVRKQIASFGGRIYKMDSLDGTWDELKSGLTASKCYFENFQGTLIVCNKARDTGQYWDGSASATSDITNMPAGAFPIEFRNYIFLFDLTSTPRKARYCTLNTYATWPSGNITSFLGQSGDIARCGAKLRGYLYAFTDTSITRISYTYSAPLFSYKPISTKIGTKSPATVKKMSIPGYPEFIVFYGNDDRIYMFDGANPPMPISDNISVDNRLSLISMETLNSNEKENFCAEVIDELNWYVLCAANRTSGDNNWALAFDFTFWPKYVAIWPFDNWNAGAMSAFVNTRGKKWYYIAGYDGKVRRVLTGNDDAGTAIDRDYITRKIFHEKLSIQKKYLQAEAYLKTWGNFNLSFQNRVDNEIDWSTAINLSMYSDEWVLGDTLPATLGSREITQTTIDLPKAANSIQFRYRTNSSCPPFNLKRLEGVMQEMGVVKE